jgi:hypothetical protein
MDLCSKRDYEYLYERRKLVIVVERGENDPR